MSGSDWFQVLIGATLLAYAVGYGVTSAIKAKKAKAICSHCDEEIDEEE